HQIDVLHLGVLVKVLDQTAKRSRFNFRLHLGVRIFDVHHDLLYIVRDHCPQSRPGRKEAASTSLSTWLGRCRQGRLSDSPHLVHIPGQQVLVDFCSAQKLNVSHSLKHRPSYLPWLLLVSPSSWFERTARTHQPVSQEFGNRPACGLPQGGCHQQIVHFGNQRNRLGHEGQYRIPVSAVPVFFHQAAMTQVLDANTTQSANLGQG